MKKTITTRDELIHLADTGDFYSSGVSLVRSRISPVCRPHWATDDKWRSQLVLNTTLNSIFVIFRLKLMIITQRSYIRFHFCSICEYVWVSVILIFLFLFILFYDFDVIGLYERYERQMILLCLQIISFILMLNACFHINVFLI